MNSAAEDQTPVTTLDVIDLAALERQEVTETEKLLASCTSTGFFYLELEGSQGASLVADKGLLFDAMKKYFDQPLETKLLDSHGKATRGYVGEGTFSAVEKHDPSSSFEYLAIGCHELHQNQPNTLPSLFHQSHPGLVERYITTCEHIVDVLLSRLSSAMHIPSPLGSHHDHTQPSDSILALLSYRDHLNHQRHTDLGSLTILFSDEWGLQVVSPSTGNWEWVEPQSKLAVINVGDTLRFLTGKKLYSCIHRVVRDGRAGMERKQRYSIAYLLRPGDDIVFRDSNEKEVMMKDFVEQKYETYSAQHEVQDRDGVLTGGMEQVLAAAGIVQPMI